MLVGAHICYPFTQLVALPWAIFPKPTPLRLLWRQGDQMPQEAKETVGGRHIPGRPMSNPGGSRKTSYISME